MTQARAVNYPARPRLSKIQPIKSMPPTTAIHDKNVFSDSDTVVLNHVLFDRDYVTTCAA
ncbi:MAG: hypothetical protein OXQ29_20690 [Rhodospirillaceae bacterium]|nr:hypothetical protein [Rhodospirillaceae bacterium]